MTSSAVGSGALGALLVLAGSLSNGARPAAAVLRAAAGAAAAAVAASVAGEALRAARAGEAR